jgi:hypothetical protein
MEKWEKEQRKLFPFYPLILLSIYPLSFDPIGYCVLITFYASRFTFQHQRSAKVGIGEPSFFPIPRFSDSPIHSHIPRFPISVVLLRALNERNCPRLSALIGSVCSKCYIMLYRRRTMTGKTKATKEQVIRGRTVRRRQVNLRVEATFYRALEVVARQELRSVPQTARQLLEEGLRQRISGRMLVDDTPSHEIAALAAAGGAFDWLAEEPDLYDDTCGEPL